MEPGERALVARGYFAFPMIDRMREVRLRWEDGATYPVIDVEISSASHPFYTGQRRVVDTAGRVERFNRRYHRPD